MKLLVLRQSLGFDPQPECDTLHYFSLPLRPLVAAQLVNDDRQE